MRSRLFEPENGVPTNEAEAVPSCQKITLSSIELPPASAHSLNAGEKVELPLTPLFSVLATENG
jgi:hypothetical protein